ncbi:MAG TPA: histidine kinase, partial [Chloroflexota bacterium]|nr:histidine kinase [Chloroflexota bacterium]
MSQHSRARVAWTLGALTLALAGGAAVFAVLCGAFRADLDSLPFFVACALVGSLIASRQPDNLTGWIMLGGALSFSLMSFTGYYALYGVAVEPGSLPAAPALAWPQTWLWVIGGASLYLLLPFYFPDGRPPSSHWQWFPRIVMAATITMAIMAAFMPGDEFIQVQSEPPSITNPMGTDRIQSAIPAVLAQSLDAAVPVVITGMLGVALAALLIRFRRSRGAERQQLKWLAYSFAAFPVLIALDTLIRLPSPVVGLYLVCIPAAVGIAILRHNLYDIDLIINRTIVYGGLTGAVAGVYIFVVGYLGALLQASLDVTGQSGWQTTISLVATGIVAVLFQPTREQLQRGVNRLMYGERDEPYTVLSRLGQRLEGSLAPDATLATIVETVREALRLPYAAIMLRESEQLVLGAASGTLSGSPVRLPLTHQREPVGELVLAPRASGETFGPADQRLLVDLARHIGTAAHNVRLAHQLLRVNADLQRSREQLVLSREEERRRLRRELHDGLAPTLAALNLKAGTVRSLIRVDTDAAEAVLDEWRTEIRATITNVRRLAYELRPPILDELGLV